MSRKSISKNNRGYFGIGIYKPKTTENIGTLWRSAYQLGASYIFTIEKRYKKQCSDTYNTYKHVPLFHYPTVDLFVESLPMASNLVLVEFGEGSKPIDQFNHPDRCCYLLGSEDNGFDNTLIEKLSGLVMSRVELPAIRTSSYNVSVAGSLLMYDRLIRKEKSL